MNPRLSTLLTLFIACFTACQMPPQEQAAPTDFVTYANPMNLNYRFCLDEPSRREAADPTITKFKDKYFLFASKSGGYWYSDDLYSWTFVATNDIPVEDYAPTAIGIGDTIYYLASSYERNALYKSTDPVSGKWTLAVEQLDAPVWDPAFFLDDDNNLFLYWGCSNEAPLYGVQVDYKNNFAFMSEPKVLVHQNPTRYGWEVPGDYNTLYRAPWVEGSWMNKYNGKYYLQYAAPGTEFKSYTDGVYVSDNPLGPFTLQAHNPFAYKPEGFAAGAGHGSTFTDNYGNYWHIGTVTISMKHMFERRLGFYPTFFDDDGVLYANTKYGDYPLIMPTKKVSGFDEIFPGWMLLSYNKNVTVSSSIDSLPPSNMVNEDIRTYWSAQTGDAGEFATVDLGENQDVYAVQINFAEYNPQLFGRTENVSYKYKVEHSADGETWSMLIDKSQNTTDNSHDYVQLPAKVNTRYLKITNIAFPSGNFAISGFRVFGKGSGEKPAAVSGFKAVRDPEDRRIVHLSWDKSEGATGYNISYGVSRDKLYQNYIVYDNTSLNIHSLNINQDYFYSIEAFNENGITLGKEVIEEE